MSALTKSRRNGKRSIAATVRRIPEPEPLLSRRFLVLTAEFKFTSTPQSALSVPYGWAGQYNDDFRLLNCDFLTRERALALAASDNESAIKRIRKAMDETDDDSCEQHWSLVFELGEVGEESFISVKGGCEADLDIKTCVMLVRPTAEELRRFAGVESEARHV